MEGNVGRTDADEAGRQWEALRKVLAERAQLEVIEPVVALPDMPFTANAGLILDDVFVPARFRVPQRRPETRHYVQWFREHGFRVVELPGLGSFEGEGDALVQPGERLVWGGYGVRTSLDAHRYLSDVLGVEVVPLRLVDERFYHLDTCFCPLAPDEALYYPAAFDEYGRRVLETHIPKLIAVHEAEAFRFGCNAVVVGRTVVHNSGCPQLAGDLHRAGYQSVAVTLDEFLKAGGSAKCLTLRLDGEEAAVW